MIIITPPRREIFKSIYKENSHDRSHHLPSNHLAH